MLLSQIEHPLALWLLAGLVPALLAVAASLWLVRECFGRHAAAPPHCVSCGQSVYIGMKSCTECGQDLTRHGAVAPSVERVRSPQRILLAIAATGLLFITSIAGPIALRQGQDATIAKATASELAAYCMERHPRSAGAAWQELKMRAHADDDVIVRETRGALVAEVVRIESADEASQSMRAWVLELGRTPSREVLESSRYRPFLSPELELALAIMNLDEPELTLVAEAALDALDRGAPGDHAARRLVQRLAESFDPADVAASEAYERLRRRIEAHPRWASVAQHEP